MRRTLWGLIFVGTTLAGCGGGGGGGGPVALDSLPAAYSKVICDQNFKCSKPEDRTDDTKQDCVDKISSGFTFLLPELRASQQKGRMTYDAAKMGACISGYAAMSCEDWVTGLDVPPTCAEAFVPKVAVGGACQQDGECIGGTCENADTLAEPPVDGACKAQKVVAHGQACAIEDKCVDGDYCDDTCKSKKAGGEACVTDDECGYSCNTTTMKCSTYAGCSIAPVTGATTLLSLLGLALAIGAARRKRA